MCVGLFSFDDIERVAPFEFHAGGSEDGAEGARGASLATDHFADIPRADAQAEDGGFTIGNSFDTDEVGSIYQGAGDGLH